MAIKYHDNICGVQYEGNKLTNNWNPESLYPDNEYVKVYFRLDTPNFNSARLMFDNESDGQTWDNKASELISSLGLIEDSGFNVEHSEDKKAYLYAHPHQLSGVVKKNDVKMIAEAIDNKFTLSTLTRVDLYETVYLISDKEYADYLSLKSDFVKELLFKRSATKRATKYYNLNDISRSIASTIRLNRLGINDGKNYGSGQTIDFITKIALDMVNEGYLMFFEDNNEKYIRSLNKTEQKKSKLCFNF